MRAAADAASQARAYRATRARSEESLCAAPPCKCSLIPLCLETRIILTGWRASTFCPSKDGGARALRGPIPGRDWSDPSIDAMQAPCASSRRQPRGCDTDPVPAEDSARCRRRDVHPARRWMVRGSSGDEPDAGVVQEEL